MINLMYLVLTAMLALNVSAEIINAFFSLDKGIASSNKIVQASNEKVLEGMAGLAKDKPDYLPLVDAAKKIDPIVKEFTDLISEYRTMMVDSSGGAYPDDYADDPSKAGKPKGYKDIDVATRLFVVGQRGENIPKKIEETRQKLKDLLYETMNQKIKGVVIDSAMIEDFAKNLPLIVDKTYETSGKSWEAYTFGYMPVAAIYPLFRKWENDAHSSASATLNFLADKMGKTELKFDQFDVFSSSQKPYILLGEEFSAELSLGASSSQAVGFNISVNGSSLPVKDNKATFRAKPSSVGEQKYSASVSFTNPATNETVNVKKEFFYEVGQPSVNVSPDKMNVFYIGVDNPISVAAAGVSSNDIAVNGSGGGITLTKQSNSKYIVKATTAGEANISVSDKKAGKQLGAFPFRVKRIPDPVAKIGGSAGGTMGSGSFGAQRGIIPVLENFDFDAKCEIQSYTLFFTKKRQDAVMIQAQGGTFSGQAAAAVAAAGIGDQYMFTDIKARCPGDAAARTINTIGITIK